MTGNVVLDDFDDLNALGQEHGVSFVATPGGYGLAFSETTESRIVYPYASGFPHAGTLEMTVNVDYGYSYSYGNFAISEQHALLFTTDIQSGDYTWPGSAWLFGFADGRLLFHIAGEKDVGGWAPAYRLWVTDTEFRFDEWHTVGISYGSAGMVIAVDGTVVGTLPTNTQQLAGGGTPYASLDQPTIGESVSGLGYNNLFEGGFNGVVEAIRYSDTQSDWALDVPPPTASLSISDAIVTEGGTLQFTVTRSGSTDQAISAYYQAFDGTADGALSEDYTTAGGYLTIAAGETTAVIEIATSYDEIVEGDETVVVRLSDPTTAITDGEAIGTIEDNDQLLSTAELFTEHGKLVTLAMLANAAYHLHEDEVVWTGYNDDAPAADALYDTLATELQLLDADDLPSLAPLLTADTFFPVDGLVDGIYTSNNGAALLARSTDALFVSFRGTNDFSAIGLFPTPGATAISPDIEDWNNKGRHYGYFAEMVDALHDYVAANPEIQVVYVTGHSLGGGMVQPFVSEAADWGVAVDATTFASPGFNDDLWPFDESSTLVSNYWNVLDPIRAAAWTSEIHGGHNIIDNGLSNPFGAMTHHSMDLYLAEIRFLHEQLPELTSRELVLNGIDYSRILMQVVEGQGGNFLPGIAADELTGSNDDEIVLGGAGNDVINAGGGNDLVLAGAGDDLVSARDDSVNSVSSLIADDIFDGGAGIDTFDLSTLLYPGDPGYTVSLDPTAGYAAGILIGRDALRNFENLIATRYDDHITGNDVQNRLEGRDGADTLIGLGGSDVLIGGKGNDRLEGGSESDTYVYLEDADTILEAGGSADVIQFDPTSGSVLRANVSFTANSGHDLIITIDRTLSIDINETITILDFFHGGQRVVESLTFTDGSTFDLTGDIDFEGSWLFGTSGDNQLTGVGSTDTVSYDSSVGSVRIDLDSSNSSPLKPASRMAALTGDSLVGYAAGADIGTDTLIGVENAVGGLGNDILIGSRYANVLDGEAGRDLLIGEGGKDFLIGGSGADEFSYFSVLDSRKGQARDVIEDFQRRADDIDLSALDASLDRAGNQAFKWIGSKAFTGKAGELHYVKKAGFILVEGDIDGNGKADFQIQLDDIAAIGKGDFIL